MDYFEKNCFESSTLGRLLEKIFLGKVFEKNGFYFEDFDGKKISTKLSLIFIANSGDGKDKSRIVLQEAFALYNKNAAENRLKTILDDYPTNTNVAGLVGTIRTNKNAFEISYGLLKNKDIIYLPECQTIFYQTEHKSTMTETLQRALDEDGEVNVQFAGESKIEYKTNCSLIMHSIPFHSFSSVLLTKGLIQRCLFYDASKDWETSKIVSQKIIENRYSKEKFDNSTILKEFIVDVCRKSRNPNLKIIFNTKLSKKYAHDYIKLFEIMSNELSENQKIKIYNGFRNRYLTMLDKISAINALMDGRNEPNGNDYEDALSLIKICLECVVKEILLIKKDDTTRKKIIDTVKLVELVQKMKGAPKETLYEVMKKEFGISRITAWKVLKENNLM